MSKKITINGHITLIPDEVDLTELLTCCSEVRAELTEHKLKLQKIETDYYTKDEIDEMLKEVLGGAPVLIGLTEAIVDVGDTFDPMAGVTAEDADGNDITSSIVVTGTVDTNTAGEYELVYSITDSKGRTTTETRKVIVEQNVYHTTLFTDGHLIINEREQDRLANEAIHGPATNEYIPWDKNNPDTSYVFNSTSQRPWHNQITSIKTVSTDGLFKPTSTQNMFSGAINLTDVDTSNWNTSALAKANNMFNGCGKLTYIDVSNWNTSSMSEASNMFNGCEKLKDIDVSHWDTSTLITIASMFNGCKNLTDIDVSHWDTSSMTNINYAFYDCSNLTTLDLSNWDTSAIINATYMFGRCSNLKTIYASDKFVTAQLPNTSSTNMFQDCTKLVGGAGTTYNNTNPKNKTYARIDNPPSAPGYFTAKP